MDPTGDNAETIAADRRHFHKLLTSARRSSRTPEELHDLVFGDLLQLGATAGNYADPTVMFGCWEGGLLSPTETSTAVPTAPNESSWWLTRASNFCGSRGSYDEDAITPAGKQDHNRDSQIIVNPNGDCP